MGTTRSFSGFKDTDTDTYASATWTANRAIESGADGKLAASSVTKTELSYLGGSTSNIQAQLNAKGTYTLPTLAANVAIVTNEAGGLANGAVSVTELGYVAGATSNIQAQIDGIVPKLNVTSTVIGAFTVVQAYADQAGANMAIIGTTNVSITTFANEIVTVWCRGVYTANAAEATDLILGYQVDSETPVVCFYENDLNSTALSRPFGFRVETAVLGAGSHTINLTASASAGDPKILASANYCPAVFAVTQVKKA